MSQQRNDMIPTRSILVAEAHAMRSEKLRQLLIRHNLLVTTVSSGEGALEQLKHERPAVLLVDAALGDMSGWQLAERIRAFDTHLPIILLTNPEEASKAPPVNGTIQAMLSQDGEDETLIDAVNQWLNNPPPRRQEQWPGVILIVDDELKIRQVLQGFLELHGFKTLAAGSGEEALEICQRSNPTIVLLDINLPGLNGLQTLEALKELKPSLPVIMITALEEEDVLQEALTRGANDYILKPFNLEYLETTLLTKILLGHTP